MTAPTATHELVAAVIAAVDTQANSVASPAKKSQLKSPARAAPTITPAPSTASLVPFATQPTSNSGAAVGGPTGTPKSAKSQRTPKSKSPREKTLLDPIDVNAAVVEPSIPIAPTSIIGATFSHIILSNSVFETL